MELFMLSGNVGKQAEVRQTDNGQAINFSVAVNRSYIDKKGEKQEKTNWYKVTLWKKVGESTEVAKYLTPGKQVEIIGTPYAEGYLNKENKAVAEQCVRARELKLVRTPKGTPADSPEVPTSEHFTVGDDDNDLPF